MDLLSEIEKKVESSEPSRQEKDGEVPSSRKEQGDFIAEEILKSFEEDVITEKKEQTKEVSPKQTKEVSPKSSDASEALSDTLDLLLKDLEEELEEGAEKVEERVERKVAEKPVSPGVMPEEIHEDEVLLEKGGVSEQNELSTLRDTWRRVSTMFKDAGIDISPAEEIVSLAERRGTEGNIRACILGYKNAISKANSAAQKKISEEYQISMQRARQIGDTRAISLLNEVRRRYGAGDIAGAISKLNDVKNALARSGPVDETNIRLKVNNMMDALSALGVDLSTLEERIKQADAFLTRGEKTRARDEYIEIYRAMVQTLAGTLNEEMDLAKEASERAKLRNLRITNQLALLKKATILYKSKRYEECARTLQMFHDAIMPYLKKKRREIERKKHEPRVGEEEKPVKPVQETIESHEPARAETSVVPGPPPQKVKVEMPRLEEGGAYLIKERKPHFIYLLYAYHLLQGRSGMCICSGFPERLKERYEIYGSGFIWLTTIRDTDQGYDPERLDFEVSQEIYDFITNTKGYIILFDALDILTSEHKEEKAIEFIRYLADHAAMDRGILLVATSPYTINETVIGHLERFLEDVPLPAEREELERVINEKIRACKEEMPPGDVFLIDGGLVSLDKVKHEIAGMSPGIAFSRESEGRVKPVISKFHTWSKIYTFSSQPYLNTIPAGDLRQFRKAIDSYIIKTRNPLVCLEGIDLCINEVGVEEVLRFLETIKKEITYRSGILILILRKHAVDPRVWNIISTIATRIV